MIGLYRSLQRITNKKKFQHLLGSAVTVKETTKIINQMFLSKMNQLFSFPFTHKGTTVQILDGHGILNTQNYILFSVHESSIYLFCWWRTMVIECITQFSGSFCGYSFLILILCFCFVFFFCLLKFTICAFTLDSSLETEIFTMQ